jgi:hypothetical protein
MLSSLRYRKLSSSPSSALVVLMLAFFVGSACKEDQIVGTGPYDLTFQLDASFQGPHGGQNIAIALVRASDGSVVSQATGTVSAAQDPSFSFTRAAMLQDGVTYEVHYWIDSNFGGGTAGVCDPKANDHQWSVEFLSVSNDVTWTAMHEPALTEDVCATFP